MSEIPEEIKKKAQKRKELEKAIDEAGIRFAEALAKDRPQIQKVEITNQPEIKTEKVEFPEVQKVSVVREILAKITNLPKWPEFMKISGKVDVDFPETQKVEGKVGVDFPDVQKVVVENQKDTVKVDGLPIGRTKEKGLPDHYIPVRLTDGNDYYKASGGGGIVSGSNQGEWPKQVLTYDANGNLTKVVETKGNVTKTTDLSYDSNGNLTTTISSIQ